MRVFIILFILMTMLASPIFAYSDIGMLKVPRTISYFLLNQTDSSNGLSSGLVYNQKQSDKWALEISYTGYRSFYLYTNNIMKFRFDEKYLVGKWGPLGLIALGGAAFYYSKSVGGGLAGDVGGIVTLRPNDDFAASLQLNAQIFKDGLEMDLEPELHFIPAAINKNIELYIGMRMEGSMVGFAFNGSQGGRFILSANAGVRAGF